MFSFAPPANGFTRFISAAGFACATLAPGSAALAFEPRLLLETYLIGQGHLQDQEWGAINPDNQILRLADATGVIDLRPEFRLTSENLKLVVRPRGILETTTWQEGAESERFVVTKGQVDLTDGFLQTELSDQVRLVMGLEVYQWGPAELYNASNPLYHLRAQSRSPFFKEKGQVLARLSIDINNQWNVMMVANPLSNHQSKFRAQGDRLEDESFRPSGFLKSEFGSRAGTSYLGALGGIQPDQRGFFGEYFNLGTESGWSLYADVRHTLGKRRFEPEVTSASFLLMNESRDETSLETLGLLGLRWEGSVDLRAEYVYNSPGYSPDEFDFALATASEPGPALLLNLARFLRPGLELYGRHSLYLSMRLPNLGRKQDSSFAVRMMTSLERASAALQTVFESPLSDSLVLDLQADVALGAADEEFTLGDRAVFIFGLKWTL